jgi:precorrin-2 dehydrogenase / sirohydrochlorin ferrochelatase
MIDVEKAYSYGCFQFRGRLVVVVGGGKVGKRKALWASQNHAHVRVVDPAGVSIPNVETISSSYQPEFLNGAALVFACVSDLVNEIVVRDALERDLWVCDTVRPERGNFILPATAASGKIQVAVSTGGAAPTLAIQLQREIMARLDPQFAVHVELMETLRPLILERIPEESHRRELFHLLAESRWRERLRSTGQDVVLLEMQAVISDWAV